MVLIDYIWKQLRRPAINISAKIMSLVLFTLLFSCETPLYVNCEECFAEYPLDCTVDILLGADYGDQQKYELAIYLGKMEDGVLIESFEAYYNTNFTALINNEYTIVATTILNDREYRAVNSVKPKAQLIEGVCEEDCYIIKNNSVNLKLKYY